MMYQNVRGVVASVVGKSISSVLIALAAGAKTLLVALLAALTPTLASAQSAAFVPDQILVLYRPGVIDGAASAPAKARPASLRGLDQKYGVRVRSRLGLKGADSAAPGPASSLSKSP